ncbi:MAG: hypothetical protein QXN26_07300, partial [Thermoplasmataceae archaeon]
METIYKKLIGRRFSESLNGRITVFYISYILFEMQLKYSGRKTARARTMQRISRTIAREGPSGITQSKLEKKLSISRSYCSELLKSLEATGTIVRLKSANTWMVYDRKFYPGFVAGLVRVGFLRSSEYVPMLSHILKRTRTMGMEVMLIEYDSAIKALEDLNSGTLDLSLVPTLPSVNFSLMNRNTLIISGISSGGSGIITSDHDCKDCILTSESSTMISLVLEFTRGYPDTHVFLDPRTGLERFINGECCNIAIWEPFLSKLFSGGKYKLSKTYHEILDDFPCCSLSSNVYFAEKENRLLDLILKDYRSGPLSLRNSEEWAVSIGHIARATGCSRKMIEKSLDSYNFN